MLRKLLAFIVFFVLITGIFSCYRSTQTIDPLFHISPGELAALVETDREANTIFLEIKAQADAALKFGPNPVDTIFYEGLIDADPRRVRTKECLIDATRAENLSWVYLVTGKMEYADKAREIILAWSRKHIPLGNPISEKELIPMITAYGLLINHFNADEKSMVDDWLRNMAGLQMQREQKNNWQAKRLWLIGYIGFILEELEYTRFMTEGYKRYVDQAFYSDGKSNDFIHRDAFHYHCSGLWPLIELAVASDRNGIDLAGYESQEGGSLKKSIDFMVPYTNGEKQHEEFVNSRVAFDRIRAEAGESEYASGKVFDGLRAAKVYEYYSYFDDSYLPLAFQIKQVEAKRFTTWKTVINHVLATQAE